MYKMRNTRVLGQILLTIIAALIIFSATPSLSHASEDEIPTLDSLVLSLNYQADGSLRVTQSYLFSDKAEIPESFSTWIRDSKRGTLFHRAYYIVDIRVAAASDMPINFDIQRTNDGLFVEVDDPQQHFSIGREIHVHYTVVGAFKNNRFKDIFFSNEMLEGPVSTFDLKIQDQEKGPVSIGYLEYQLVSDDTVVAMSTTINEPRKRVFESKDQKLRFPIQLEIVELEARGGSELATLSTSLQRFLFTNAWFFAPLALGLILLLLAWVLSRERVQKRQVFSQRPKPPEGMDPGTMSVILHGGVSARYFAAISLWLANRGKLMLEYRPGKKYGRAGMILSKKADLDSATREHERYVWNNVLFQGVDSMSMERMKSILKKGRNRSRIRGILKDFFPHRYALKRPKVLEWWLWPKTYLFIVILIFLLALSVGLSFLGLILPELCRWEWLLGFPAMFGTLILFMAKADWTQHQAEETDAELMSFVSFLEQPPRKLKEIAGDQKALSILLPYAVACGAERNILDIYCGDKTKVALPAWFMIYGNTTEEIHVHEVKSVLSDFIDGMLDVF